MEEVQKQGTDARCLENLVDRSTQNDTFTDSNMWLAPLANLNDGQGILSDFYVCLSAILMI